MQSLGDPQQHSGFDEPSHSDPVSIEAYGNGDGDKPDGECKMQQVDGLCRLGTTRPAASLAAEEDVQGRQCQREPCRVLGANLLEDDVDLQKISSGVYHRHQGRHRIGHPALRRRLRQQWRDREDGEEQCGEADCHPHLSNFVEARVPAGVQPQCSEITQNQQSPPGLEDHQGKRAQVQNDDISE